MNPEFRPAFSRWLKLLALLTASAGLLSVCLGAPGEKIEFSDATGAAPSTNIISSRLGSGISRLNTGPNALRQIQDDLFNPLTPSGDPMDSMQGVLAPQVNKQRTTTTPAEARRAHRRDDKQKNWAVANMNELNNPSSDPTNPDADKDVLSLDGQEKNAESVISEFVNGKSSKSATNQAQAVQWYNAANGGRDSYSGENGVNPDGRNGTSWNQIISRDFFSDKADDSSARDSYGLRDELSSGRVAADFSAAQKQRDDFRNVLDSSAKSDRSYGMYGGHSSSSLFSDPSPAAAYAAPSSLGSSDLYGSANHSHTVEPLNNNPVSTYRNPAAAAPASVQELLDPASAVIKRPSL